MADLYDILINSDSVLTHILWGEIGLIFGVLAATVAAKGWPTFYDLYKIFVFSLLTFFSCVLLSKQPIAVSFLVGVGILYIWKGIEKRLPQFADVVDNLAFPMLPQPKDDDTPEQLPTPDEGRAKE